MTNQPRFRPRTYDEWKTTDPRDYEDWQEWPVEEDDGPDPDDQREMQRERKEQS